MSSIFMVCLYTGCEVYNLGTGKGTSVLEMVRAFEQASGKVLTNISFSCSVSVNVMFAVYFNVIFQKNNVAHMVFFLSSGMCCSEKFA